VLTAVGVKCGGGVRVINLERRSRPDTCTQHTHLTPTAVNTPVRKKNKPDPYVEGSG